VPGKPLNDGPVLSGITSECQPERIDWPFDHPNLKGEILGSTQQSFEVAFWTVVEGLLQSVELTRFGHRNQGGFLW
jgi:hypothetical protein